MCCLALDIGERRTGVAIGEVLARPLLTLKRGSKVEDFGAIGRLVRQHRANTVVVGLPLNMDGSKGFQARKVERYAALLEQALHETGLKVQVVLWDERLSTETAERVLAVGGRARDASRGRVDQVAAAVILQSYLDRERDTEI